VQSMQMVFLLTNLLTVKPVLRGHDLWDTEKVAL
jgi:hypothetical protein